MNYEEARNYLDQISAKGSVLGLDSIQALLEELGNPQNELKFVHIAGTNGKGSVMSYLAAILKEAGLVAGRYISPTLFSYEERIQINGTYIGKEDVARLVTVIAEARERVKEKGKPSATIFEVETAMSFLYFKEQGCSLVLLETGLGGREDATNVVASTVLEILASISMDHMDFLGNTLAQIAWNKAGIIKPDSAVVSDWQQPEAEQVIRQVCREQKAELHFLERDSLTEVRYGLEEQSFSYRGLKDLKIHLAGTCQIENAALAVDAALALGQLGYPVYETQIRRGLEKAVWSGRFQAVHEKPWVIMDGAHNPDAARVLMDAVDQYFPKNKISYIFGVFSDKEYDKIIEITAKRADHIYTVETRDNPRALKAELLAEAVKKVNPSVEAVTDVKKALDLALAQADLQDVILVFGSLSFLWEVKAYFS